jgi:hypothetical protein
MKQERWPEVLMVIGYGVAIILIIILNYTSQSSTIISVLSVIESIGIGVGSVGLGSRYRLSKHQAK